MKLLRPRPLSSGDTVAVVTPSWAGPAHFPAVYEAGLRFLREGLSLRVKEAPLARAADHVLRADPRQRATELHDALRDPEVKAIVASVGGEDTVRLLPYLAPEVFTANPKILLGYSDFTAVLSFAARLGLVAFHGPTVMAGLAQAPALGADYQRHLRDVLFAALPVYEYRPFPAYSDGYPDWSLPGDPGAVKPPQENRRGWRFLQGKGRVRGRLFGGCLEVLEFFLKGTPWMPPPDFFDGRILFLEIAEPTTRPAMVRWALRGLGASGVLDRVAGLLVGRARDYTEQERDALEEGILEAVSGELGRKRLPVVANLDFGHTDPQLVMPLNGMAEIDCDARRIWLAEATLER